MMCPEIYEALDRSAHRCEKQKTKQTLHMIEKVSFPSHTCYHSKSSALGPISVSAVPLALRRTSLLERSQCIMSFEWRYRQELRLYHGKYQLVCGTLQNQDKETKCTNKVTNDDTQL